MQIKPRSVDYYKTPSGKEPAREWLTSIKDKLTLAILFKRIRQAGLGQFGKNRHLGESLFELKINQGPGYRIYFGVHRDELILVLSGGSKKTQTADIEKARIYWAEWKERNL